MPLLKHTEIRKLAKEKDKRLSSEFLGALEYVMHQKIDACISQHNGGKKTLTADAVHYFFGVKK